MWHYDVDPDLLRQVVIIDEERKRQEQQEREQEAQRIPLRIEEPPYPEYPPEPEPEARPSGGCVVVIPLSPAD
jgi:hypothetical protein